MSPYEAKFRFDLKSRGYKRYPPAKADGENVEEMFQKCFSDDIGKKYYIDIKVWNFKNISPEAFDNYRFEANLDLYLKETGKPVHIKMFIHWTLEEIEKYAEDVWNSGMYEYYEKYNK